MKARRHLSFAVAPLALACLVGGGVAAPAQQVEAFEHDSTEASPRHHQVRAVGYLGLSVRPLNDDLRRHFGAPSAAGVLIASVDGDSPAASGGLEVGDVLVAVDGRGVASVADLHREVRSRPGERLPIEAYRDGERLVLDVTIGSRAADHGRWPGDASGGRLDRSDWGEDWDEWGEDFGDRWAELGAEMGERWGEIGAEIGLRMAEAFADMDWDEMDRAFEESMRALDAVDWDEIGEEIERALEEIDDILEETLDDGEKKTPGKA